ncbi:hypothetical protein [Spirillospora sp. NPDC047279]|uniref:hypothetical protein n=1 Tax=Spirillospora sp. NPDC047279 TaxID=3155478 RepID=UPI0033FA94B7
MEKRRDGNAGLAALLAAAGWSGQDLARAVNAVGAEAGLALSYGRASVAQWRAGIRPRRPVPELVAEALSRRLGRVVDPAEIGLAGPPAAGPGRARPPAGVIRPRVDAVRWWEGEAVPLLAELADAAGPRRGELLRDCVFNLAALKVPGWDAATRPTGPGPGSGPAAAPVPAGRAGAGGRPLRVGEAEVEAASTMLRVFSEADTAFGAGQVRLALADHLGRTMTPWLRAAEGAVRRDLLSVAAKQAYLCGFMCFDDELHGMAQRYYRSSLSLAAEAGALPDYAVTLRAMSVQARVLGHDQAAYGLADSAAGVDLRGVAAPTRAFLLGQLAVTCAATGARGRALRHLSAAERELDRATGGPGVVGAYHPAALAHQQAAVRSLLGDRDGAIGALEQSIARRPAGERRSRTITLARLAELQLRRGHLERAAATWHLFLDEYPAVRSGRARTAFASMYAGLRSFRANQAARELLERADAMRYPIPARLPSHATQTTTPTTPPTAPTTATAPATAAAPTTAVEGVTKLGAVDGGGVAAVSSRDGRVLAPGCVVCGRPLERAGTGRPRRYCGQACRQRAYRARTASG